MNKSFLYPFTLINLYRLQLLFSSLLLEYLTFANVKISIRHGRKLGYPYWDRQDVCTRDAPRLWYGKVVLPRSVTKEGLFHRLHLCFCTLGVSFPIVRSCLSLSFNNIYIHSAKDFLFAPCHPPGALSVIRFFQRPVITGPYDAEGGVQVVLENSFHKCWLKYYFCSKIFSIVTGTNLEYFWTITFSIVIGTIFEQCIWVNKLHRHRLSARWVSHCQPKLNGKRVPDLFITNDLNGLIDELRYR